MNYIQPLEQFCKTATKNKDSNYLNQPTRAGLNTWTWGEVEQEARSVASFLLSQGFDKGARVGILSKNCAEWIIADLAIMMAAMVSVPIYPSANRKTITYVLENSECDAIFIGPMDDYEEADAGIPAEITRILFPYSIELTNKNVNHVINWKDLLTQEPINEIPVQKPEETMSIAYTSGSTGNPKGVVLSFNNFASAAQEAASIASLGDDDRMLSYLPLAHITERGLVQMTSYYAGIRLFFVECLDSFVSDLKVADPSFFISVPRLWNKFQSGVLAKMPNKKLQLLLKLPLLNRIVAKKIRKELGFDNARIYGSGSAPISPAILHWFNRLGVSISEGWGMTETTGLCCTNLPFYENAIGTIGRPMACVEMKLNENQEIMIRGDAVFEEYYKNPVETAKCFTNGWFHTGDMGAVSEDGNYSIIGRVKEQFKSAKGKYVTPAPIESLLGRYTEIEQACVVGAGRKQPIALVVMSPQTKVRSEDVHQQLLATLKKTNSKLEGHQRLDHIIVVNEEWSIENELLTPTLKIKRTAIEQKYQHYLTKTIEAEVHWENE